VKEVLVILQSDPRTSARAAEGARVADGLSHGEDLAVALLIEGPAAAAFAEPEERWVEGSLLLKHLMALCNRRVPLYLREQGRAGMLEHLPLQPVDAARAGALRSGAVVIEF
jgi:hypothetical protein